LKLLVLNVKLDTERSVSDATRTVKFLETSSQFSLLCLLTFPGAVLRSAHTMNWQ